LTHFSVKGSRPNSGLTKLVFIIFRLFFIVTLVIRVFLDSLKMRHVRIIIIILLKRGNTGYVIITAIGGLEDAVGITRLSTKRRSRF
jgi:hypothetical protein